MPKIIKAFSATALVLTLSACAIPHHYGMPHHQGGYTQGGHYVRVPPPPPQPPRRVVIRTETHRVLTPRIIMEPCCRMQPDVIYVY